jgi:hypothetical protein
MSHSTLFDRKSGFRQRRMQSHPLADRGRGSRRGWRIPGQDISNVLTNQLNCNWKREQKNVNKKRLEREPHLFQNLFQGTRLTRDVQNKNQRNNSTKNFVFKECIYFMFFCSPKLGCNITDHLIQHEKIQKLKKIRCRKCLGYIFKLKLHDW